MTGTELAKADDINERYAVRHTDKITPFIPEGFASVLKFAELIAVSGMAPKGLEKADKVAVAIFHGMEVGFTPMAALQSIAVINGRPSVWGDGALAMVRASGLLDDIDETYDGGDLWLDPPTFDDFGKQTKAGKPNPQYRAVCTTTRKGAKRAVASEFSVLDAMTAGLWNKEGPWRTNPKRMLKMRARGFNLRDEFTDVMRGLVLAEEAQDYGVAIEHAAREEPPEDPTAKQEIAAPRRARKAKEPDNKYQGDDSNAKVEDAEIITETAKTKTAEQVATGEKADAGEDPPADPKPKEAPKKDAPEAKEKPVDKPEPNANAFRDALLEEIGPDKPLKDHIIYIDTLLRPHNTIDTMKTAWDTREKMAGLTKSQIDFVNRMRDHHKERIQNIPADDEPPADTTNPPVQEWDYTGYLHDLDVMLGAIDNAEDVNKVYAAETAGPIRENLVTTEQIENDLRPLLAAHLERTDFGS